MEPTQSYISSFKHLLRIYYKSNIQGCEKAEESGGRAGQRNKQCSRKRRKNHISKDMHQRSKRECIYNRIKKASFRGYLHSRQQFLKLSSKYSSTTDTLKLGRTTLRLPLFKKTKQQSLPVASDEGAERYWERAT